jgi:hypothetical protein
MQSHLADCAHHAGIRHPAPTFLAPPDAPTEAWVHALVYNIGQTQRDGPWIVSNLSLSGLWKGSPSLAKVGTVSGMGTVMGFRLSRQVAGKRRS